MRSEEEIIAEYEKKMGTEKKVVDSFFSDTPLECKSCGSKKHLRHTMFWTGKGIHKTTEGATLCLSCDREFRETKIRPWEEQDASN